MSTDQATIRFDQTFKRGDSLFARYSFSSERGFMPQNLPGFGATHDNLSQTGTVGWNHIRSKSQATGMGNLKTLTFGLNVGAQKLEISKEKTRVDEDRG
jgi:hypothetical protein